MSCIQRTLYVVYTADPLCRVYSGPSMSCIQRTLYVVYTADPLCRVYSGPFVSCIQRTLCVVYITVSVIYLDVGHFNVTRTKFSI